MNVSSRVMFVIALVSGVSATAAAQGKEQYDAQCKKCHGAAGTPAKAMMTRFPKLEAFDSAFFAKRSDDSLMAAMINGTSTDMKSYKDKLTREDMLAITAYIKEFAKTP